MPKKIRILQISVSISWKAQVLCSEFKVLIVARSAYAQLWSKDYFFPFFFFDGVFCSSVFIPFNVSILIQSGGKHTLLGVLLALETPLVCTGVSFSITAGVLLPEADAELGAVLTF
jgi:hypothetical protein